jgi:hypothetical protein
MAATKEATEKQAEAQAQAELKELAQELTEAKNEERAKEAAPKVGVGVLRTRGGSGRRKDFFPSEIPYPEGIHGDDYEFYGPSGFAAEIPKGTDIAAFSSEQGFVINPEKVKVLYFQKPGRNLPKKRLYTIKAIHKDGRLVQLPFEKQIQNNAGGDPEDAIGLRRYERKGIYILIDWATLMPVYCAAWGCLAQADQGGQFAGFCTEKHAKHTLPNQYKNAGAITQGIFGDGATTSRTWSA